MPDGFIKFEIGFIVMYDEFDNHILILLESNGTRQFELSVGSVEAWTILNMVEQHTFTRPLTHAAMLQVIEALGGQLEIVVIDELDEHHAYHAILHIRLGKDRVPVDVRPSDALALAVASQSPVYIAENLYRAQGTQ